MTTYFSEAGASLKNPGAKLQGAGCALIRIGESFLEQRGEIGDKEAVHQVRVAMKRVRALLRLVRSHLPAKHFAQLNALCRTLAASLSSTRDADVARDTLGLLIADDLESPSAKRLRQALDQSGPEQKVVSVEPDWTFLYQALEQISAELMVLPIKKLGRKDLRHGLATSYRRGRKDWRRAGKAADTEVLHDWRKAVKNAYYQNQLLTDADRHITQLKKLSDHLGDLHDLDMLEQRLLERRHLYWLEDLQWLTPKLLERRQQLLNQSLKRGGRIYVKTDLKIRIKQLVPAR